MAIRKISDLPAKTYEDIAPLSVEAYKAEQNRLSTCLLEISYTKDATTPYTFSSFSLDYGSMRKDINEQIIGRKDKPYDDKSIKIYKTPIFCSGQQISVCDGLDLTGNVVVNKDSDIHTTADIKFDNMTIDVAYELVKSNIDLSVQCDNIILKSSIDDTDQNYMTITKTSDNGKKITINTKTEFTQPITCNTTQTINGDLSVLGEDNAIYAANVMVGCALCAKWADLAEGYESDSAYEPGTLVKFGGEKEITIADDESNAVITTNPGLVLGASEQVSFKQNIALVGRVPVKVVGNVKKFDKLVLSEIPGVARAKTAQDTKPTIGRALQTVEVENNQITLVESVVQLLV